MMMHPRSGSDKRLSTVHVDGDTPLCITSGALTWINDSFQKNVHRAMSITELECQLEAVQREAFLDSFGKQFDIKFLNDQHPTL